MAQWQTAMGIDWTDDRAELAEAIPPVYTEHLGRWLIETLTGCPSGVATLADGVERELDGCQLMLFA
ncbi:hypothetical protein ACFYTS_34320 [Nocardia sp. NPDC004151]|uniref:hypothetical protein n=1 Tax=Nocardia sp. NPDC004151 TaxID=3364304 RepID=UPI0036961038